MTLPSAHNKNQGVPDNFQTKHLRPTFPAEHLSKDFLM